MDATNDFWSIPQLNARTRGEVRLPMMVDDSSSTVASPNERAQVAVSPSLTLTTTIASTTTTNHDTVLQLIVRYKELQTTASGGEGFVTVGMDADWDALSQIHSSWYRLASQRVAVRPPGDWNLDGSDVSSE